jgi:hypothetical protein
MNESVWSTGEMMMTGDDRSNGEENLPQWHTARHKYHNGLMTGLEFNSGVCGERTETNGAGNGMTALKYKENKVFHKRQTTLPQKSS